MSEAPTGEVTTPLTVVEPSVGTQPTPPAEGTAPPAVVPAEGIQPAKTYTQDEVDRIAQKERERAERKADRRYTQTLERIAGQGKTEQTTTVEAPKRESFKTDEEYALA